MDLDQAKTYLARVMPWPQEGDEPAYVNIHYTFVPKDGLRPGQDKLPWAGRAVRTLSEAVDALSWAAKNEGTRDIYACLSTQRHAIEQTGKNNFKYYKPIRGQDNAVKLKSLFIDLDFKDYKDQSEACAELARFLKETSLPRPNLLVMSGGGAHLYWALARALTLAEWRPLAYALAEATRKHGLKCDTQCTVDGARVLRIPGTLNRKLDTPRPVSLAGKSLDFDYTVERITQALEPYKTATPAPRQTVFLDPELLPLRPPLEGESDLSAGIEVVIFPPNKIEDVAAECPFVREALVTGGKEYTQPEWNLTTLIATFCEDGRKVAHNMGNKHPEYTQDSTDALYDRKEREKAQKGLGWPSCAAIGTAGCKACQGCKHFNDGKSPLHFGLRAVTQKATSTVASVPFADPRSASTVLGVPCANYHTGNTAPDPLRFTNLPRKEAVARINTEFFVLRSSGKIYRQGDDGELSALPKQDFKTALVDQI